MIRCLWLLALFFNLQELSMTRVTTVLTFLGFLTAKFHAAYYRSRFSRWKHFGQLKSDLLKPQSESVKFHFRSKYGEHIRAYLVNCRRILGKNIFIVFLSQKVSSEVRPSNCSGTVYIWSVVHWLTGHSKSAFEVLIQLLSNCMLKIFWQFLVLIMCNC